MTDNKPRKTKMIVLSVVALIVVAGLAVGGTLLATKHTTASKQTTASATAKSATAPDTSQYKLAACTSGTTQTLGNAGYVVGTDLAAGKYTVKDVEQSAETGTGWSNVDIYAKQADYKGHNDGNETDSVQPFVGDTTSTMLKNGEYVSVWADSAVFTCQ